MKANNPLLEAVGPYRPLEQWPALLEHDPLDDFPQDPDDEEREEYLQRIVKRFAVTKTALNVAFDIQGMIRHGYHERNPCDPKNQKKMHAILDLEESYTTQSANFYPESLCLIVRGITGMGKSQMVKRILGTYPQVAVHGKTESAQWLKRTQIIHLTVKMPADGSRSGILLAIFLAIDAEIQTNYFDQYAFKRISIERLTLKCSQLLALYSIGLLVIEEMQAKNFMASKYRDELQLFFLGLLSFGIPLVLVGNPLAFEETSAYTQTQRRFLSVDPVELWPYPSPTNTEWSRAIAPAIWGHQVVDNCDEYSAEVAKVLWECSGGIPAFACKLVNEGQKAVLKRSSQALTVSELRRTYEKLASFEEFRSLIKGLVDKDTNLLSAHEDIPFTRFERRWEREAPSEREAPDVEKAEDADDDTIEGKWNNYSRNEKRKKKAAATRKKTKAAKNQKARNDAKAGDLRGEEGTKGALSKKLQDLRKELEREENTDAK